VPLQKNAYGKYLNRLLAEEPSSQSF
jgi:hypothetical protein